MAYKKIEETVEYQLGRDTMRLEIIKELCKYAHDQETGCFNCIMEICDEVVNMR